ncbi:hypothetical protein [Streptomyces sp. NPDC002088]|uniref:hypothetical protein n=1 Tax=Streptomyces sp. NPDC002088 TaxID=3154665 RepID=UPI00331E4DBF
MTWDGRRLTIERLGSAVPRERERLRALRGFRAQVLHADGRRPEFRTAGGCYADAQEIDEESFHISVSDPADNAVVAYGRLSPAELTHHFQTRDYLGDARFHEMTVSLNTDVAGVWEAGRLVVAPQSRGQGPMAAVGAALMAMARTLDAHALVAVSGMQDRQHILWGRFGLRECPGTHGYSAHYQDDLCVVAWRTAAVVGRYETGLRALQDTLVSAATDRGVRMR